MTTPQIDENKPDEGDAGNNTPHDPKTPDGIAQKPDSGSEVKPDDVVTRDEFEKVMERMKAADRRASTAEEELKKRQRAEQTELEQAQGDVKDITAERDSLLGKIKEIRLENAFLSSNKHAWHDPSDALRLIDLSSVEIDENGKVKGLDTAIERLAKAKPHLIKTESSKDDAEGADGGTPASGPASNGKRKGDPGQKPDYTSRFPALKK
jgi:hypothetical protein